MARIADLRLWGWKQVKDGKLILRVRHFNYLFFFFFFFFFFFGGQMRRSNLSDCIYSGRATFGIPSGIGLVVRVPFRIGPMVRKPGAATLIQCKRGSFALMTHFGA